MKRRSLKTGADKTSTCLSCLTVNKGSASFCDKCGAPVSATATVDPVQTIQTEGFLLRKSLEGRPKLIVLLGIWILHLPVLVVCAGSAIYLLFDLRGSAELVFVLAFAALACYAFIVLYRITKNYLTAGKK